MECHLSGRAVAGPFYAVYPRLTGGPPATLLDFAPDEACRSGSVAAAEVGFYPAISPLPDHLTTKNVNNTCAYQVDA